MKRYQSILRLQRNILLGIVSGLFISNSMLAIKLYHQQTMVILVPTIENELKVSNDFVSDEYLKLRAEQITNLLFSIRGENSTYVTKELLKQVDSSNFAKFRAQIDSLAEDISLRGYRYWFTDVQKLEINNQELTVKITGSLETYLGERQINRELKTYELKFKNRNGLVNLETFREVKDKK